MSNLKKRMQNKKGKYSFYRRIKMSKKKNTPSSEVDQKQLLNDKVENARKNNFEDDHTRRVTPNGGQGE
jgi:hypothetical protein